MFLVQSLTSVLYVPSYKGNDAQDIEHELDYCSVEMYSHKCRITGIAIHSSLTKHRLLNSFQSKEKQKEDYSDLQVFHQSSTINPIHCL